MPEIGHFPMSENHERFRAHLLEASDTVQTATTAELVQNGTLKTYAGFPHGMPTTQAETINADLLEFIRS